MRHSEDERQKNERTYLHRGPCTLPPSFTESPSRPISALHSNQRRVQDGTCTKMSRPISHEEKKMHHTAAFFCYPLPLALLPPRNQVEGVQGRLCDAVKMNKRREEKRNALTPTAHDRLLPAVHVHSCQNCPPSPIRPPT